MSYTRGVFLLVLLSGCKNVKLDWPGDGTAGVDTGEALPDGGDGATDGAGDDGAGDGDDAGSGDEGSGEGGAGSGSEEVIKVLVRGPATIGMAP